ncbi:CDP-diacylglycerol--glycerol-3-phosphate 3-phosphatidyltransferase [Enemella sp. A6]|uniref:CDP-diacylglycerol--glycerol-3-phosphate 3-phosphatidyltransferase n=1 Tax=Enemella sp. A6 TaxID=3440152 RepID=UPI003EB8E13F
MNGPNVLTTLRILMVPLLGWMLIAFADDPTMRIWTTVVFCVAMLTDLVDGWWARRANLITSFGKIADPIADKLMTGMALVGLSIIGELWWWVTIVILVREWGITVMRFALLRFGEVQAANKGGKIKTVVQTVALILFLLPLPQLLWGVPLQPLHLVELLSWILMMVALLLTVVSGVDYVRAAIRMVREHEAKKFAANNEPGS